MNRRDFERNSRIEALIRLLATERVLLETIKPDFDWKSHIDKVGETAAIAHQHQEKITELEAYSKQLAGEINSILKEWPALLEDKGVSSIYNALKNDVILYKEFNPGYDIKV